MRRALTPLLAWLGFLLLLALHLDFWRPRRAVLYGGWLPEELVWRLLWMLAAWLYLLWFTARVWRGEGGGEGEERREDEG